MSDTLVIEGQPRTGTGKGVCRKLRASGKLPANLITREKSIAIEIDPKWLSKAWKNGKTFDLKLGDDTKTVVIKELQLDAAKRIPLHVDLMYA